MLYHICRDGGKGMRRTIFSIPDFSSQGWTRINIRMLIKSYQARACRSKINGKCRTHFSRVRRTIFSIPDFPSQGCLFKIVMQFYKELARAWAPCNSPTTVRSQSDLQSDHSPITVRSYILPATWDVHRKKISPFKSVYFFQASNVKS